MGAELRAWLRGMAATPRFDFVLVAVVIVLAESEIWLPTGNCVGRPFPFGLCNFGESLGPRPVEIAYTTLAALALLARRRRPVQVLLAVSALSVLKSLVWVASPGLGYFLPVLVASYSVGRYHRGGHPWLVLIGAGLVVVITSVVHDLNVPGQIPSGQLATFYALLLGVLPIGRSLQGKDLRIELSEANAREATLARDEAARRAVADERARIARELHDVAAHGVSLIVVQAVAAQGVLDLAPARARASLEAIETEARQAWTKCAGFWPCFNQRPRPTGSNLLPVSTHWRRWYRGSLLPASPLR